MRSTPTRSVAACALAAVALALTPALAACSGSSSGDAQPGPGQTGGAQASGSGGGSYSSSANVISALKSAGHPCTPVSGSQDTDLKAPGLRSVTACTVGSSDTVTATVFDNHTDAQAYATLLTSAQNSGLLIGSTSTRAVLGQNWVVLVPDDTAYASQVSAALGGSVLGSATASATAN